MHNHERSIRSTRLLSGDFGYLLNRDQTGANGNSSFVIGANNANTVFWRRSLPTIWPVCMGLVIQTPAPYALKKWDPECKFSVGNQCLYWLDSPYQRQAVLQLIPSALNYSPNAGNVTINSGATLGGKW